MSLYTRGRKPSLGRQYASPASSNGLGGILEGNPLSYYYRIPEIGVTPQQLTLYLIARQKKQYGEIITDQLEERILRRHVRLMLNQYDPKAIIRGIEIGLIYSPYPFSFAFVEKQLHGLRLRSDTPAGEHVSIVGLLPTPNRQEHAVSLARRQNSQLSAF